MSRMLRFCLSVLGLALLAGCAVLEDRPRPAPPRVADDFVEQAGEAMTALDLGDDELAAQVILRMRARGPDEETLAWIVEVERVLEGRRQVDRLGLALVLEEHEEEGARVKRLVLEVVTGPGSPLTLHMTPPLLAWDRDWISAEGHGGRASDAVGLYHLEVLELAPDSTLRVPVMDLPPARGQAAALRERWVLDMRFCWLDVDGTRYTTNAPHVAPLDRYLLASQLRLGALEPGSAAELLAARPDAPLEAVVERVVRVLPAGHEAALDALTDPVLGLPLDEVGRVVPALLWLTGGARARGEYVGEAGDLATFLAPDEERPLVEAGRLLDPALLYGQPLAWKRWLQARAVLRARNPASPLDLPDTVGEAVGPPGIDLGEPRP